MPDPTYDPNTPAIPQNDDWSCAITSARWAMTAYGRHPTEQWIESTSLAEAVESTTLGLMDASGAGLAGFITEQYGEFGYHAYNVAVVSFNDVMQAVGLSPVLIGGRDWAHWTGVRRYDPTDGRLALANPADHYMGVGQTLNRQQFADLGSFSMVVITWGDGAVPAPADQSATIAALQAQVAALAQQRDGLIVTVADIADRLGDQLGGYAAAISATVDSMRSEREQAIGPRP